MRSLTPAQAKALQTEWRFWARPEQQEPPGDWTIWLIQTGRGWGKTRTAAETVRKWVREGRYGNLHFVGATAADVRDTMIEGPAGILSISTDAERPTYESSKRKLTWPNGATALLFSAEEPDRLRGPQCEAAWCDELAAWRRMDETWDMLMMGLRLGTKPRVIVTTTPKPRALIKRIASDPHTHLTRGSTYDNLDNLAESFAQTVIARYKGTRLGRQELSGEYLEDVEGALWQRQWIDAARVATVPDLQRVVVAVDPAATSSDESDETGIVVCALGVDARWYVLADRTCRMSPDGWGRRAISAFEEFRADRIVAEVNNGGEMVQHVLRTILPSVPVTAVHASRGKVVRAEPIAALYEQGRVSHVGTFPELEDQLCSYTGEPGETSPDRMDALVWGLTELRETKQVEAYVL
ncbi:MAG: DNA-packaging protein [Veillonellaceae bacterium]|nr:DNA-packaging protein [Veillonellaceae bacterium]